MKGNKQNNKSWNYKVKDLCTIWCKQLIHNANLKTCWAKLINELHLRSNRYQSSNSAWNNVLSDFTYLMIKIRITRAPKLRVKTKTKIMQINQSHVHFLYLVHVAAPQVDLSLYTNSRNQSNWKSWLWPQLQSPKLP